MPNCCWTLIPKLHVLMLLFNLSQGLRKCWLLLLNQLTIKKCFKPATGGNVFFGFFKVNNEEIFNIVFPLSCSYNKRFARGKKTKTFWLKKLFWAIVICKFSKRIFIFKVPLIFWKWKLWLYTMYSMWCLHTAHGWSCQFFWNWTSKKYLIDRNVYNAGC